MPNTSSNMGLPIPIALVDTGPNYALYNNNCFTIIDSHDHSAGSGVQISPAGLNINADLTFGDNNAIDLKSVRFEAQTSLSAVDPDLLCLYVVGNDIYYNDGAGNAIRITQSGSVSGASGTITGLPSGTASAAYSAGSGKFTFQSASNTGADMDIASIIIREKVASGKGVTLSAPTSLAADYTLIAPGSLPGSTKFMSLDSSGNIASSWAVDNSTIEVSTNSVQVKDSGIATAKIADGAVTPAKKAALGQQVSSSSGSFATGSATYVDVTNLTVTITTIGRPVYVGLIGDGTGAASIAVQSISAGNTARSDVQILRGATSIHEAIIETQASAAPASLFVPVSSFNQVDVVAAGTYTYKVQMKRVSGDGNGFTKAKLIAYEL